MSFKDKVVIVTGASRGIGQDIAVKFAAQGAKVACIATKKENLDQTLQAISVLGGVAFGYGCDVSQKDNVDATIDQILSDLGIADVLVNNAGVTRDSLLLRMKESDWDDVINIDLKSAFLCTQAVIKGMMKARYGRLIHISSISGTSGAAGQANYAAAKSGLIGFSKSIAKEIGSRGITSNVIAPGYIETDMTSGLAEEFKAHYIKNAPAARLGEPKDISAAVLFLASQDAGFITGQTLVVDGGFSLG
jgi:3-oxoacyl-[acyl-carrier protein] reductase